MNTVKMEILLGAMMPLRFEPAEAIDLLTTLISDLSKVNVKFPLYGLIAEVKIKRVKFLKGVKKDLWASNKTHIRQEIVLQFSSTIQSKD